MRFKLLLTALLLAFISQSALAQLEPWTDYDISKEYLGTLFRFENLNENVYREAEKLEVNVVFAVDAVKNPVEFNPVRLPEVINSGPYVLSGYILA